MEVIGQRSEVTDTENDILQQLVLLSSEIEQNRQLNVFVESTTGLRTASRLKRTLEMNHGMHKYVWEGRFSRPFTDLAAELVDRARKEHRQFWLAHVAEADHISTRPSFRDGSLSFDVSQCCAGALVNPFTFYTHVIWKEDTSDGIHSSFDFDRQMLRVEFTRRPPFKKWKMEISFAELGRTCLVEPETRDGGVYFSLYVYLSCAPSFWIETREWKRITQIPGAELADIGKCSVLKLDINTDDQPKLFTLLSKMDACQFEVWWTSLNTLSATDQLLGDLDVPWPVEWLLSQGYRIGDQLSSADLQFLSEHQDILYTALKGVISREIIVSVMDELRSFLDRTIAWPAPELPNNYTLIKKVAVTPTRVIFLSPEPVKMNRALRKYNPNNFVMVLFVDENQRPLHSVSEHLVERIETFLLRGLKAEGRTYTFIGLSKSQLCKHSCWMCAIDPEETLSQLEQFLTSSVPTIDLSKQKYKIKEIPDVERNGCCFTEGFGKVSQSLADEIAKQCDLGRACSAYQILLGGCKGILTVDPKLPEGELQIRPSMKHSDSPSRVLEVVECSLPQRAYLNEHIITQMSKQDIADNVLLRLQYEYLRHLLEMFTSNENALLELADLQTVFDLREISERGIKIVSDPFFRSILLARYKEKLNDLLEHASFPLPPDQGRVLMGVVDETGQLQPGEVFLQYSNDINDRESESTILTEPVIVTQYRCKHPGDLHVFKAVNCPDLCHLVDCLVFPTEGDRRDPDNNLYWTTWHPDIVKQLKEMPPATLDELEFTPNLDNLIKHFKNMPPELISQTKLEPVLVELFQDASHVARATDMHLDVITELSQNDAKHIYRSKPEFGRIDIPDSYREIAERYYTEYATRVQHILDAFHIRDESYLFAASGSGMKNDDKQDSALLMQAEIYQLKQDYADIFENKDTSVSLPIKAMTWFSIAYDKGRLRSFAWIASFEIASVLEERDFRPQCDAIVEDCSKLKNMFDSSQLDDEIKRFLQIQESATEVFLKAISTALPSLQCSLVPTELDKLKIPSRDIFIKIRHPNADTIAEEFSELCSVIPNLILPETDKAYDNPSCCITKTEISKKFIVGGQEFTAYIYKDCAFAKVLHEITSNINSELFSKCLQIVSQYWMMPFGKTVQHLVSVIHILEMFIFFYLKNNRSGDVYEVLKKFLLNSTDFDALVEFQSHSCLLTLTPKSLRLFQLSLLTGLQLLLFYGTHVVLNHNIKCVRKKHLLHVINMSAKASRAIKHYAESAEHYIAQTSGCHVAVRCVSDKEDILFVVEGFGNKQQLARLADVIYHIENIAGMDSIRYGRPSRYRYEPIFENSTSEDDRVIKEQYEGHTTFPFYFKKCTVYLDPNTNDANAVQSLEKVVDNCYTIISRIREDYDEHFHGQLGFTCRFTNFHFSTKEPITVNTIGDFHNKLNDTNIGMKTCNYPVAVNRDKLAVVLNEKGLKQDDAPKSTILVKMRPHEQNMKEIVLNENLQIERIRYQKNGIGSVNYVRNVKRIPGQKYLEKTADLYIRLETRLVVPDSDMNPSPSMINSNKPILSVDQSSDNVDMPLLKVENEYKGRVAFIRQRKVTTYSYPPSFIKQKPGHFTAHVKVEVSDVREYNMRSGETYEYTSPVIVLPALAPSRNEEELRDLIRNMIELAVDIGDSVGKTRIGG